MAGLGIEQLEHAWILRHSRCAVDQTERRPPQIFRQITALPVNQFGIVPVPDDFDFDVSNAINGIDAPKVPEHVTKRDAQGRGGRCLNRDRRRLVLGLRAFDI